MKKETDLKSSGLLGLPNGLNKSSSGKSLHTAIPQTGSRRTVPEQLKCVVRYIIVQPQNGGHVYDLQISPKIIDHNRRSRGGQRRRRRCRSSRRRWWRWWWFENTLEFSKVAWEGKARAGEDWAWVEGPGGEGGDEAGGLERIIFLFLGGLGLLRRRWWEVGSDEAERGILGSKVE